MSDTSGFRTTISWKRKWRFSRNDCIQEIWREDKRIRHIHAANNVYTTRWTYLLALRHRKLELFSLVFGFYSMERHSGQKEFASMLRSLMSMFRSFSFNVDVGCWDPLKSMLRSLKSMFRSFSTDMDVGCCDAAMGVMRGVVRYPCEGCGQSTAGCSWTYAWSRPEY